MENTQKFNLLCTYQAYNNCIKSNNIGWAEKHLNRIESVLNENLSHGSGIDCKWKYDFSSPKCIICSNSFHKMNEDGYYDRYIDFKVRILADYRDIWGKIDFKIIGNFGKYADIKDYLYTCFAEDFENIDNFNLLTFLEIKQ